MSDHVAMLLQYKSLIIGCWFGLFFLAERLRPAAQIPLDSGQRWRRLWRNATLFAVNFGLSLALIIPITQWAGEASSSYAWLGWLDWRPAGLVGGWAILLDLLILDFWIYWWHRASHESQFLWRFHQIHHLDQTLDVTTGLRFHGVEVIISALVRAVVIIVADIPISSILIFETMILFSSVFQHSNLRLPARLEGALGWVVVTPAIHWMHHHAIRADTDSNYCNTLSLWDRLFGTRSAHQRTPAMPIGVEGLQDRSLVALLLLPLKKP